MSEPGRPVLLDWSDRSHWNRTAAPCRYCGNLTHLRDDHGKPAEKVCAENHIAQQTTTTTRNYRNGII